MHTSDFLRRLATLGPIALTPYRAHVLLSGLFVATRASLYALGIRFYFSLDWMWLSDPDDLRERLLQTLYYYHAFPPGMNALTGALLKLSVSHASSLGQVIFWILGLAGINALFLLGRLTGLSQLGAFLLALGFAITPPAIYFEHLYLYDWPVTMLLIISGVLFSKGIRRPSVGRWLAYCAVGALIGISRSTFHLIWFLGTIGLGAWICGVRGRRAIVVGAIVPTLALVGLYTKNYLMFGEFAASTFGPSSLTLLTVAHLPEDVRERWIADGILSAYARVSVYAPPRAYAQFFQTANRAGWPRQLTNLEHTAVSAPNFNHWWLLDVHRARRADVLHYLKRRPFDYLSNVLTGFVDFFRATTTWHPRDGTAASPHFLHRKVLGPYERVYNTLIHSWPVAPFGLYIVLPFAMLWAAHRARHLLNMTDPTLRAGGAVLALCVFQIIYVTAASTMLTFLESARYRFQIEWMIWLLTAHAAGSLISVLKSWVERAIRPTAPLPR